MTGATIVRWEAGSTVALAVHGAFDGASAWALRLEMEDASAREFEVDLTYAVEACDFAASLFAVWTRQWGRLRHVRFRPGCEAHERILAGHGLDLAEADEPARSAGGTEVAPSATGATA